MKTLKPRSRSIPSATFIVNITFCFAFSIVTAQQRPSLYLTTTFGIIRQHSTKPISGVLCRQGL